MKDLILRLTVTDVISANRLFQSPVGITLGRQNREHWAIVLKAKGQTVYTAQKNSVLSDERNMVILPRGSCYTWRCTSPGECLIIEFDAAEAGKMPLSFSVRDNSPMQKAFSKIEKLLALQTDDCQLECRYLLYGLLLFLSNSVKKDYVPTAKQQMLAPAVSYMAASYFDRQIGNDFLAARCGVSTVYFRKVFERVYGIPPMRYLRNIRLEKAKSMLASDYESVSQVAESVGYNSIYHFCKMFKQYTGLSPGEYAKNSRH